MTNVSFEQIFTKLKMMDEEGSLRVATVGVNTSSEQEEDEDDGEEEDIEDGFQSRVNILFLIFIFFQQARSK